MTTHWYIRKADGAIYGPATMVQLKEWVSDGRIEPDDKLSIDEESWTPAVEQPELQMEYLILFPDGQVYGPVHQGVLVQLIQDADIAADQLVRHVPTDHEMTAQEASTHQWEAPAPAAPRVDPSPSAPVSDAAQITDADVAVAVAEARAETAAEYYERLQVVEAEKSALAAAVEARDRELEEANQAAQAARLEIIHAKKAEIATLRDRIQELEDTQQDRAVIEALESQVAELSGERDAARAELAEQTSQLERLKDRAAGLEKQLTDALAQLDEQAAAQPDTSRQEALEEELSQARLEMERVQEEKKAQVSALQKQVSQLKAQIEELNGQVQATEAAPAADARLEELQRAWDADKAAWSKREQQYKQRLAQFEGELKEKMAAFVEAKQVVPHSTPASGEGAGGVVSAVPRAALTRLQEQAATGSAAIHRPAAQTQRAAELTRVRVPPKKHKRKRPPIRTSR